MKYCKVISTPLPVIGLGCLASLVGVGVGSCHGRGGDGEGTEKDGEELHCDIGQELIYAIKEFLSINAKTSFFCTF